MTDQYVVDPNKLYEKLESCVTNDTDDGGDATVNELWTHPADIRYLQRLIRASQHEPCEHRDDRPLYICLDIQMHGLNGTWTVHEITEKVEQVLRWTFDHPGTLGFDISADVTEHA